MIIEPAGAPGDGGGHRWAALLDPLTALWRAVGLAALWLLACLPVVSAGAATVALLAVVRDDVLRRHRPVVRSYAGYLRENALLGSALLAIVAGPIADLLILGEGGGPAITVLRLLALLGVVAALPVVAHGFGLAAHTRQTVRSLYRASVIMTIARPGPTLIALAVVAAVVAAATVWPFALLVLAHPAARALFLTFRRTFETLNVTEDESDGIG